MAADPRIPTIVLEAAIAASGEIARKYPHSATDLRTDVSAMLIAALDAWAWNPIPERIIL